MLCYSFCFPPFSSRPFCLLYGSKCFLLYSSVCELCCSVCRLYCSYYFLLFPPVCHCFLPCPSVCRFFVLTVFSLTLLYCCNCLLFCPPVFQFCCYAVCKVVLIYPSPYQPALMQICIHLSARCGILLCLSFSHAF